MRKTVHCGKNLCFKILTHPVMDVPCDIGSSQRQHHSTGAQASKHTHTHTHTHIQTHTHTYTHTLQRMNKSRRCWCCVICRWHQQTIKQQSSVPVHIFLVCSLSVAFTLLLTHTLFLSLFTFSLYLLLLTRTCTHIGAPGYITFLSKPSLSDFFSIYK